MIKIFEALQQGHNDVATMALGPLSGAVENAAPPAPAAQPEPSPVAAPAAASIAGVRSMRVAIPASIPVLPFDSGSQHAAEQYRILRTRIIQHPRRPRMLVISSATPGDGKTTTAINLAGSLALKQEGSVLLVDADLRRSALHASLGLPASPGLQQVLEGQATLEEALVAVEDFRQLYVLTAGDRRLNPAELLDSERWSELCARLRAMFTYIVIDSPPIGALADSDLIQATADGVIVVVRPDHTGRDLCLQALRTIPQDKLTGVLLNCVPEWFLGKYGGYPNYHRYYAGAGK